MLTVCCHSLFLRFIPLQIDRLWSFYKIEWYRIDYFWSIFKNVLFSFPYFKKSACSPLNESRFFQKILSCMISIQEWVIMVFFWPKDFFWSVMKMTFTQNIPNMSQFPPNPGYRLPVYDFLPYRHVAWKWETFVPYKTGSPCDQPFHFISLNTRSLIAGLHRRGSVHWLKIWEFLKLAHFKKDFGLHTNVDCFW